MSLPAGAPNYAGLREWRRSQITGHQYGLYDGIEAGLDTEGGRWQTVCEDHGAICSHQTLRTAQHHLNGGEWCEQCVAEQLGHAIIPPGRTEPEEPEAYGVGDEGLGMDDQDEDDEEPEDEPAVYEPGKGHVCWFDGYEYFLTGPETLAQAREYMPLDSDGYRIGAFVLATDYDRVRETLSYIQEESRNSDEWEVVGKFLADYQEPEPDPATVGWIAVAVENVARIERFLGFGARVREEVVAWPSLVYTCLIRIPRENATWQAERLASGLIGNGQWSPEESSARERFEHLVEINGGRPDPGPGVASLVGRRFG